MNIAFANLYAAVRTGNWSITRVQMIGSPKVITVVK
jgi:hypothetical protein